METDRSSSNPCRADMYLLLLVALPRPCRYVLFKISLGRTHCMGYVANEVSRLLVGVGEGEREGGRERWREGTCCVVGKGWRCGC